jgi:putative pyruvate formate lyase activating enzyme
MLRPDAFTCWSDPVVRDRLGWYRRVMQNQRPGKFLICRSIPSGLLPEEADEERLWDEHTRLTKEFRTAWQEVIEGHEVDTTHFPRRSFLDVKAELLNRMLRHCIFCEWKCGVDRVVGTRKGACRMDATTRVATWFQHFGEETPLLGAGGSGTVFFAGCVFRCVFCQNWDISQYPLNGEKVDGKGLAAMMKTLRDEGTANINFVGGEPTPNLHTIVDGMRLMKANVPMLWNSDMYLGPETMKILTDLIDIWLPDFKYGNDRCALRLSKVVRYMEVTTRNHKLAYENGDMIVRHLILPNHFECCTKPVLDWIAENCPRALVNVMGQYRPDHVVQDEPELYHDIARSPNWGEIRKARRYAEELKIEYRQVS